MIDCGGTPTVNWRQTVAKSKMALDSLIGPEEQKVLNLLKRIEKVCAGDNELAHASYELKSLVSFEGDDADCTIPISILTDSYTALRQSETYSSIALSLVYMIINHVMSYPKLEPLEDLRRVVNKKPTYEIQVKMPRLLLRRSLAKIALDLTESEAEDFISVALAAEELKPLNPDRLGKSARILKLFERMEEKGLVKHTGKELPVVARILNVIKRPKLIEKLDDYDPARPIWVATVIELQACIRYINLSALVPKLNEQDLLTSKEEEEITDSTRKLTERMETLLLKCVATRKDGGIKFMTALKAETSHDGHATLLKMLPSIEGEPRLLTELCPKAPAIKPLIPKEEFIGYLRKYFKSRSLPSDPGKWAPKVSTRYINLALVEKGEVNKVEADEFTQASIHGDIDDIIKQKRHMEIEHVAPLDEEGDPPKYILVEGAPGVGKTAFAWELSKRWGKGEILKHFEMVVLLRLREVRVRKMKSIPDLFFYSNSKVQEVVAREVEKNQGYRVLFILEGFDELPTSNRSDDYLLCQMLKGDILPACSILVTTRHSASAFLFENFDEPDQHIQILGFTRENITSYYESVLKEERVLGAFKRYLGLHPHILSAMYVPLHCAIVVEVFINSFDTQTIGESKATIPKTMTQLYYSLTKCLLMRYLKKHKKYGKMQFRIQHFDRLPGKVPNRLKIISELAYNGLIQDKVIFTDEDVPFNFDTLELMQSIPELYTDEGTVVSYNFIHLTLQEFLAAYYISFQEPERWIKEFKEQKDHSRMKVMLRFLAGLTSFSGIRKKHIRQLSFIRDTRERREITVDGLHWLFEAQFEESSYTAMILGKSIVRIDCTWSTVSQFDCFVLGFCIARSKCKWELEMCECDIGEDGLKIFSDAIKSNQTVKQDEESVPGQEKYSTGFISSFRLRGNGITSAALCQLFQNTPPQVFTKLEELELGNNRVDAATCNVLGQLIPFMPRLHSISLSGNTIGKGGVMKMLSGWSNTRCRKLLSLFNTRVGVEDTTLVAELIAKPPGIEVVFLGGCDVPTEIAERILQSLKVERWYMRELYFGGARFTLETSKLLASVIRVNKTLEVIDLRYCKIDEEGGKIILDALKENTILKDVMVTKGNSLGSAEAEEIHKRFPQEDMMGPEL